MTRINRDTIIAIVLLLFCGAMFWASLDIREPDYGVLKPSTWPRIILAAFGFLSTLYLAQSIRRGPDKARDAGEPVKGLKALIAYWSNVLWVFALFLCYLFALPWVGMLIGGVAFVFLLLMALGNFSARDGLLHAAIALITAGGMWLIFTYALGVLLPRGELTGI